MRFGSAALSSWLPEAPRTRNVDLWCEPAERGEAVGALTGELSWYQERHDAYVEVWGPETSAAPSDRRRRARVLTEEEVSAVWLFVPHARDAPMPYRDGRVEDFRRGQAYEAQLGELPRWWRRAEPGQGHSGSELSGQLR